MIWQLRRPLVAAWLIVAGQCFKAILQIMWCRSSLPPVGEEGLLEFRLPRQLRKSIRIQHSAWNAVDEVQRADPV